MGMVCGDTAVLPKFPWHCAGSKRDEGRGNTNEITVEQRYHNGNTRVIQRSPSKSPGLCLASAWLEGGFGRLGGAKRPIDAHNLENSGLVLTCRVGAGLGRK